jgi:hypothetical protein
MSPSLTASALKQYSFNRTPRKADISDGNLLNEPTLLESCRTELLHADVVQKLIFKTQLSVLMRGYNILRAVFLV